MPDRPARPVYVLHGSDDYLRLHHRGRLVNELLGDAPTELAVRRFDPTAELADVLDELRTVPFLAPRRVVILTGADPFVTRHRAALEAYLGAPADRGSLILEVSNWQGRWRLAKIAAKVGEIVDCSPPRRLGPHLATLARERGKRLAGRAGPLLAEWVGNDLARLDSEIEKLALYVGPREEITADDVAAVVAATAGPVAFALANALGARDLHAALTALGELMTSPGEEYRVLGLIAWHLRRSRSGHGARPTARAARDARRVLSADLAIKTGAAPATTMELLVADLCR